MRLPIPLSEYYGDTRLDADVQRIVNMYPHAKQGFRQFPALTEFAQAYFSIANFTLTASEDISALDTEGGGTPPLRGVAISPDGTTVFIIEQKATPILNELTLSTPWDITTSTLTNTENLTGVSFTAGLWMSDDGTYGYIFNGSSGNSIVQLNFSTGWDSSTWSDRKSVV